MSAFKQAEQEANEAVAMTSKLCERVHGMRNRIAELTAECTLLSNNLHKKTKDRAYLIQAANHAVTEWRLHGALTDSCRELEAAIAGADGDER